MLQLANAINTLNEKDINYKVVTEGANLSIIFGVMARGQKTKVELIPGEEEIKALLLNKEKTLTPEELTVFIDNILELKAINEQETKVLEALTE